MSRKKRYIENLTSTEIQALEKGFKEGKSHTFRNRCKAILLSHQGYTTKQLCEIFGVKLLTIYRWLDRWESSNIDGLMDKEGRGRKPILDLSRADHVTVVEQAIEKSPKNLNKVLAQLKKELDVDLSKLSLKRFLKNLNEDGNVSEEVH